MYYRSNTLNQPHINVLTKKAPDKSSALSGWKTGFEPATSGTTIQRSNQLNYIHHVVFAVQI